MGETRAFEDAGGAPGGGSFVDNAFFLVEGSVRRRPYQVRYDRAAAYEQFKLSRFMEAISTGLVRVDFDAYIQESGAVRDHGVKFRVKPENLRRLYDKSERL